MSARASLLVLTSALLSTLPGCGEEGHEASPFTTYQACFDEHMKPMVLTVTEAIVECCLDHPIAGQRPACGADRPECINYLTANLNQTSASTIEVMDACTEYENTVPAL